MLTTFNVEVKTEFDGKEFIQGGTVTVNLTSRGDVEEALRTAVYLAMRSLYDIKED
jgi:hypothetical protein